MSGFGTGCGRTALPTCERLTKNGQQVLLYAGKQLTQKREQESKEFLKACSTRSRFVVMITSEGTIGIETPPMIIRPATTRDEFLASPLFAISKPLNQNAPWSRYSFRPFKAGGEELAGDICFCWGLIHSFSFASARVEFGSSWNNYSSEKERARHAFHKNFLRIQLRRSPDTRSTRYGDDLDDITYEFSWGTVSAAIDMHSMCSGILIQYPESGK